MNLFERVEIGYLQILLLILSFRRVESHRPHFQRRLHERETIFENNVLNFKSFYWTLVLNQLHTFYISSSVISLQEFCFYYLNIKLCRIEPDNLYFCQGEDSLLILALIFIFLTLNILQLIFDIFLLVFINLVLNILIQFNKKFNNLPLDTSEFKFLIFKIIFESFRKFFYCNNFFNVHLVDEFYNLLIESIPDEERDIPPNGACIRVHVI